MFVTTKKLQLIIKGQYINNSNFVKPTLNLHTYEIQFLMLIYVMIFPNTTFTKDDNVQIHAYTKDVWYLCLFGHIAWIKSTHIWSWICDVIQLVWSFHLIVFAKYGNVWIERWKQYKFYMYNKLQMHTFQMFGTM
jgi:hypothetical protein